MSWKGFQKAINCLPHQILSKKAEATNNVEFKALEKKFEDSIKVVERLYKDVQVFRDQISAALTRQAHISTHLAVIYDPHLGQQVAEGVVQKRVPTTSADSIQAVNDAEAAMAYCRDEVLPELDLLDRDVTRPLLELLDITKIIQKTMVKRNHKMIDYDRHRSSLAKLKAKQERNFNDEKQIFKIEAALETATQDYDYLNDMLKQQIPQFFILKIQFIEPVFEKYYFLQAKIYGMIYARCYELYNANLNHFTTNQMGITDGFQYRKSQHDIRSEVENMDLLKSGGKAWVAASGGANNSKLSLKERAALREQEKAGGFPSPQFSSGSNSPIPNSYTSPPPAYTQPSPPARQLNNTQYVIALYDYQAQAEGDLTFKKDDKIEVIERTQDQNDWWTGRLGGVKGIFPGNYVADL
ncbi:unnamed protein product [Cunninghamella blakesleeana]